LPYEFHTTDFVINEIEEPDQNAIILQLIEVGTLKVISLASNEIDQIFLLQETVNRLSIPDCSVWHYSKKYNHILLTGDNLLRKTAEKDHVIVRGILFVFDELVRYELLKPQEAFAKLEWLLETGSRLPDEACKERFERWTL
jgi:hypothetical protein